MATHPLDDFAGRWTFIDQSIMDSEFVRLAENLEKGYFLEKRSGETCRSQGTFVMISVLTKAHQILCNQPPHIFVYCDVKKF